MNKKWRAMCISLGCMFLTGCGIDTSTDVYKRISEQTTQLTDGTVKEGIDGLIEQIDYCCQYVMPVSFIICIICCVIGGLILGFAREDVGMKKKGIGFIVIGILAIFIGIVLIIMADMFL